MAKQLFANNASALLAASIDDNDLTIQVTSTFGALFPDPGADEEFIVSLINSSGDIEHCRCTDRTGDLITVAPGGRGYDGSSAQEWTNGQTRVEYRLTKAVMEAFIQRGGDVMEGDLDMDGNELQDARITGDTVMVAGQLVGTAIRGTEDDSSNEIAVPSDGSRATAGGSAILTEGDDEGVKTAAFEVGMIMDWYGAAVDCPTGWAICDGTNGTPDMRGLVSIGVSGSHALDSTGGSETSSGSTGSGGGHSHGGATGSTTLTTDQMPSHAHRVFGHTAGVPTGTNDALSIGAVTGEVDGTHGYTSTAQGQPILEATGGGSGHTHTIAAEAAHTHTVAVSVMQPYRALHKIMFIGF